MGAPLPPSEILPKQWADKATLKTILSQPGMEEETGYWIEQLQAWVAEDEEERDMIRSATGETVLLVVELLEKGGPDA